jgi:hypothetical protein
MILARHQTPSSLSPTVQRAVLQHHLPQDPPLHPHPGGLRQHQDRRPRLGLGHRQRHPRRPRPRRGHLRHRRALPGPPLLRPGQADGQAPLGERGRLHVQQRRRRRVLCAHHQPELRPGRDDPQHELEPHRRLHEGHQVRLVDEMRPGDSTEYPPPSPPRPPHSSILRNPTSHRVAPPPTTTTHSSPPPSLSAAGTAPAS